MVNINIYLLTINKDIYNYENEKEDKSINKVSKSRKTSFANMNQVIYQSGGIDSFLDNKKFITKEIKMNINTKDIEQKIENKNEEQNENIQNDEQNKKISKIFLIEYI